MLTLMEIELVLHYYWSPEEHPYVVNEWPGANAAIANLLANKLLTERLHERECGTYEVTDKAEAYVAAIRGMPLPLQETRWVMPQEVSA